MGDGSTRDDRQLLIGFLFPCRGATIEPSPAFLRGMKSAHPIQSPQRRLILPFSSRSTVAAATKLAWNWRPALKSRARLKRRSATEEILSHLFLKNYKRRAKPESATTRRVRIRQYL